MDEYSGEKFLDELYKDLQDSKEVNRTKKNTDSKEEAINRYLDLLERAHGKYKETLKGFYYEKYIAKNEQALKEKIKKENRNLTEERINDAVKEVMTAQKVSLDKWLDYLSNDAAYYPAWAKYWAFQGMLKMGTYDDGTSSYQTRNKYTEAPYVDANPEILAKAIEIVVQKVEEVYGDKRPSRRDIEKLKQEVNFPKLYAVLEKKYVNNVIEYSGTEGIWKKYDQGSKEEALRLNKDLQNKNTHWCTASSESMAIRQICGPYTDASEGGDFYVYYTKDKEENYTLPRIAIRMSGHDEIGEIRGVLDGQNLEEEMVSILKDKLNEMTFLMPTSKWEAFAKLDGLRELTRIYQKTTKKEDLTEEEITHLYTKKYGFGWEQDPKVEKIIKKRNFTKDFETVKDNDLKVKIVDFAGRFNIDFEIKDESFIEYLLKPKGFNSTLETAMKNFNPKYSKNYDKLAKQAIKRNHSIIEYINPEDVTNYEELAKLAVINNAFCIQYINPKYASNYEELATIAVKKEGWIIKDIKREYVTNYKELAKIAVKNSGYNFKYIKKEDVSNYEELVKIAVMEDALCIQHINPKDITDYNELATTAVKQNGLSIVCINPEDVSNYEELAQIAVTNDGRAIRDIKKENIKDYDKLAKLAVTQNGLSINHISLEDVTNYDELAKLAVTNDARAIQYIKPKNVTNYDELAEIAVKEIGSTIQHIKPIDIADFDKLARLAIDNTPFSIHFIKPENVKNYEELAKMAVTKRHETIELVDQEAVSNYNELEELSLEKESANKKIKLLSKISTSLKNVLKNQKEKEDNDSAPKMGFIDILSLTTLVMTLGIVILIIIKIFNK